MKKIETSDGLIFMDVYTGDKKELESNISKVMGAAERIAYNKGLDKEIMLLEAIPKTVNKQEYLDFFSGDCLKYHFNVSDQMWNALDINNFNKIGKSILKEHLGVIIGNGENSIDRAQRLLEIIKPHGAQDFKIKNDNGIEDIYANVDGDECVIRISFGRGNRDDENIIYQDRVSTNHTIDIMKSSIPENIKDEETGILFNKFYEDPKVAYYLPSSPGERVEMSSNYRYACGLFNSLESNKRISDYCGMILEYSPLAYVPEAERILYEEIYDEDYPIVFAGEDSIIGNVEHNISEEEIVGIFPSLTLYKR